MTDEALDLLARRASAQATVHDLERERGAALLDGKDFDATKLTAARAELEALDAAEAESVRRTRVAEGDVVANMRSEARKALSEALEGYMTALGRAEGHATALIGEFLMIEAHAKAMRQSIRVLGHSVPLAVDDTGVRTFLSDALISTLAGKLKGSRYYGSLTLPSVRRITDWRAWGETYAVDAVKPILEPEQ